jgi:hypothetical protein
MIQPWRAVVVLCGKGCSGEVCDTPQSRGNSPGGRRSPRRSAGVTPGRTAWWAGYFGDAAKFGWMVFEDTASNCVKQEYINNRSPQEQFRRTLTSLRTAAFKGAEERGLSSDLLLAMMTRRENV